MERIRVLAAAKQSWITSAHFHTALCARNAQAERLAASLRLASQPAVRGVHFGPTTSAITSNEEKTGFFSNLYYKLGLPDRQNYRSRVTGQLLYEDIANNVDYSKFFKDFNLPDTFYSWFVIMELHVWMLMIRFMAEGKYGHVVRNSVVEAMWADVNIRKSKLKKVNLSVVRKQLVELSYQFNAAVIGYDEGIMCDDKVLAAAIWRRFMQSECNNPVYIEKLVEYVRKQVCELERIPKEEIMSRRSIQWIDYEKP